jgi:threonine/homoserine/homoserine lactone efflux protein
MSVESLLAFALFALVSSITPGPNNTMMLASGVNFGYRRSVPHLLGICIGLGLMVVLMGLGLGTLFTRWPMLYTFMRYAGGLYLLYLAWKIFRSAPMESTGDTAAKPMSFFGAAAFQWVNPKAWVMALTAVTTYLPAGHSVLQLLVVAVLFCTIGAPSVSVWALFGSRMRSYLRDPRTLRIFNSAMALALVASLYPLFVEV